MSWPAIRAGAFDRQPGRADAPSGARVARRPAHGGAQCFARPSGRNRPRRAAGRAACLWPEAHGCRRFQREWRDRGPRLRARRTSFACRQIDALDEAIGAIDRELAASVKADETAKRLMTIPGVGPVTASAITATIQDASAFASGREFAAFLGLTPRQNSTGGKTRLGRITKMGDRYLRKLLVVGACATLRHRRGHSDALRLWASGMLDRKTVKYKFNLTAVGSPTRSRASSSTYCGCSSPRPWMPQLGGIRPYRSCLAKDRNPRHSRHSLRARISIFPRSRSAKRRGSSRSNQMNLVPDDQQDLSASGIKAPDKATPTADSARLSGRRDRGSRLGDDTVTTRTAAAKAPVLAIRHKSLILSGAPSRNRTSTPCGIRF